MKNEKLRIRKERCAERILDPKFSIVNSSSSLSESIHVVVHLERGGGHD